MNNKVAILGIVIVIVAIGAFAISQSGGLFHKTSDLRYDYDEQLYYTMQGAVPYGDDHLMKIKAWNKSDEPVDLPMHFKFVLKDGTEITATSVGHRFHNTGTTLNDSGKDTTLHTRLAPSEVETYECIIHVSGYSSKLPGKLVCTDEGWDQYDF